VRAAAADESQMELSRLEWAALRQHTAAATAVEPTPLELLADSAGLGREGLRELLRAHIARVRANQPAPPSPLTSSRRSPHLG
jgi:hypothetical protein